VKTLSPPGRRVVNQATSKHAFSVYHTGPGRFRYEAYITRPFGTEDTFLGGIEMVGRRQYRPTPAALGAAPLAIEKSLYDAGWALCRHYEKENDRG
jgi:hypothetical protein